MRQQADEYLSQGQYDAAIALYEQCIDVDPTEMSNYWHLGLAWLLQEEESQAQAIWLSALTQGTPEEVDVWMAELLKVLEAEGTRHLYSGKLQLAEKIYWQILELDSEQAEAHYNLGHALAQQGDFHEAVACWQRAIDLKPDFAEAYQEQGCVFQKLEEFDNAIACYLKALEIKPSWIETQYNLGLCFSQCGRLDEAIGCFRKVVQLDLGYTQAYGDLGNIMLQKGNLDEAIAYFKNAIQIKPEFAQAYCNWVDILGQQGKLNESINANACLLKALLDFPDVSSDTYLALGNVIALRNDFESAIVAYQKAIQLQPDSEEIYFELGKALNKKGNFEAAITAYQRALQLQPDSEEIYFRLGKALADKGSFAEGINLYQKVLKVNPKRADVWCYLGNAWSAIGKFDKAIFCYQQNLNIQPNSVDAYCNLGIALAQINKADEAIASFRKVMEINPDLAKAVYDVIILLSQQGKLDEKNIGFQDLLPVDPPKDFYESTRDWAVSFNLEPSNYISIYPKNIISLKPPKTPDINIHFSFRFGNKVELPESFLAILPDGRYWLNKSQNTTAIITADNKLLADISPEFPVLSPGHQDKHPSKHSIFSLEKLPFIQRIDGTVAVLSGLLNNVYFHWMFDILPRIQLLYVSGIEMAGIDKFLIDSRLSFQRETLKALGIAETKTLEADKYFYIEARRLVVPSFPGSIAWMPKWACDFLKSAFLNKKALETSEKIERLYISRKHAENRRIINEDEVISLLNKFGFKSITLELMSVAEQAALLANAKVVIAPHGGGLTNTVFCNSGTKVIEIFSPNYVYPCYWLVANLIGLEYYYLLGEMPEGSYLHKLIYPNPRIEDIFVNINKLLSIMKFAEVI